MHRVGTIERLMYCGKVEGVRYGRCEAWEVEGVRYAWEVEKVVLQLTGPPTSY